LLAVWCLSGATSGGPPWTPAVTLAHGCDGLSARRFAVLWTFSEPSLGRHVPHEFMRRAGLDFTPRMPATACHQRSYFDADSRSIPTELKHHPFTNGHPPPPQFACGALLPAWPQFFDGAGHK